MLAAQPTQIICSLIDVLNASLRRLRIRPHLQADIVEHEVRERIEAGVLKVPRSVDLIQPVVPKPQFVQQVRRERMKLGDAQEVVGRRIVHVEGRQGDAWVSTNELRL